MKPIATSGQGNHKCKEATAFYKTLHIKAKVYKPQKDNSDGNKI